MPCGSHKYKPPNKGINETSDPPETGRTVLDDNDNKLSYLSQHVANIEKEHTAMKSELNNLKTTIEVLEDHIGLLTAQQDGKLNDLKSHVGQLEKLQKQAPPAPPAPPAPKPTVTTPKPTGTKPKQTVTQNGKSAPSGHFTETPEFKNKMKKLREASEKGRSDQDFDTNIKGMGVVGKKQGKKLQIFGKQNRYTV